MFDEVLKICKRMISADITADVKQEIKEMVFITFNRSAFSKPEIKCKTGLYF